MKNDKTMPNVSNFERFNTFLWVLTISTILHDCPSVNGFGGGGPSGGSGEKKQLDKECLVHNSNQNEPLEYCAYANYGRTASYCLKVCASEGADYGGPVTSLLCCCGSSLNDSPSNKGCDDKCSGDDTEACGHQESAIISTIDENQPKLEYDGDLKYIGCFSSENIEQEQASEQPSTLYRNLYPSFCIAYCKDASDSKSGIMYAGLGIMKLPVTTLYKCLCLEKKQITKEGLCNLLPEESCSEKCPGNDEKCGSENAVNLYKLKEIDDVPNCEITSTTETTLITTSTEPYLSTTTPTTTEEPTKTISTTTVEETTTEQSSEATTSTTLMESTSIYEPFSTQLMIGELYNHKSWKNIFKKIKNFLFNLA